MEVRTHTSKKHRAIGYYFKICRDVLKGKGGPKILSYVDLFCGDGTCEDPETKKRWDSSFIELLKHAKEENLDVRCYLNDINAEKIQELKQKIAGLGLEQFIMEYNVGDANVYYKEVLTRIPKGGWTIFFLDPTNHKHLKWSTIKGISEHKISTRMPELIVHFSVFTIGQDIKSKNYDEITASLGTDKWKEKVEAFKNIRGEKAPVFSALYELFVEQLTSLGYKVHSDRLPIRATGKDAPLYYLIFCTSNPSAFEKIDGMVKRLIKLEKDWQAENKGEVQRIKNEKNGYRKSIDQFCK